MTNDNQVTNDIPADTAATIEEDFTALGLNPDIVRAVIEKGYTTATPIQAQAIPYILMGRDVLGCAQTGTGKTASFTLPMIEILANGRAKARMPRSLVLAPTRELAAQVADNFVTYGKYHKLNMALLIGGETMDEQVRKLDRGVDVVIATPGRMLDLHGRGKVLLSDIKILVIDEADRMLDMGFIPDVEKIVALLPKIRQTLFFSATLAPEVKKLAAKFLSNPKEVAVAPSVTTAATVTQHLVMTDEKRKRDVLRDLLRQEEMQNAFIFCNRKRDVALLFTSLKKLGFNVGALHGDMVQSKRTETLDAFKRGEISILVCSDVAARGLDISGMSHVFNFDVPFHAEDYVHRIGRTGRAGKSGIAYTLATEDDAKSIAAIEKLIKNPLQIMRAGATAAAPTAASEKSVTAPSEPHAQASPAESRPAERRRERPAPRHRATPSREPREDIAAPVAAAPAVPASESHAPTQHGFGDHLPAFMRRA